VAGPPSPLKPNDGPLPADVDTIPSGVTLRTLLIERVGDKDVACRIYCESLRFSEIDGRRRTTFNEIVCVFLSGSRRNDPVWRDLPNTAVSELGDEKITAASSRRPMEQSGGGGRAAVSAEPFVPLPATVKMMPVAATFRMSHVNPSAMNRLPAGSIATPAGDRRAERLNRRLH